MGLLIIELGALLVLFVGYMPGGIQAGLSSIDSCI